MRENHENRSVSSYGSYVEVQGEDLKTWGTQCVYSISQLLWLKSRIFFSLETISSDLWTISYLLTLDCNFLLIWANYKCFGTCVQTVSAVCTTTNCVWLVDQNRWVYSHLNCQTLHNFSIIFHHVSITFKTIHSIIKNIVYTRVYSINIWHWHCL